MIYITPFKKNDILRLIKNKTFKPLTTVDTPDCRF